MITYIKHSFFIAVDLFLTLNDVDYSSFQILDSVSRYEFHAK